MARRTYPRKEADHAVTAARVLADHQSRTGRPIELPVPIDMIIERDYGLDILWEEIAEPPNSMILGALFPLDRRIVMNARHSSLFDRVMGPERFTKAHELAHWIYDADDPNQLSLDVEETPHICYERESSALTRDLDIREVNANKLASHLLLPEELIRAADIDQVVSSLPEVAAAWGVSQQALRIRLHTLGLLDDATPERQLPLE